MIIDAHQHFWNLDKVAYPWLGPEYGPLYRSYEADELEPLLRRTGVDKTIIVQAANSYEDTDYMLQVAQEREWVGGIVGWVPLHRPAEAAAKLELFAKLPIFKGVRHLIHEEKDPDWIIQDSVIESLQCLAEHELTFDLVAIYPKHLNHIHTLVEKVPNLKIVIDHLAKPPIKRKQWQPWGADLKRAAESKNVYAKVSGLNTAADPRSWSAEDLKPAIDIALDAFGAERLMFGSDWPVANLAGDYQQVWEQTNLAISALSQREIDAILGKTAEQFYRL